MADTTQAVTEVNPNLKYLAERLKELLGAGVDLGTSAAQVIMEQIHYLGLGYTILGAILFIGGLSTAYWMNYRATAAQKTYLEKVKPDNYYMNQTSDSTVGWNIAAVITGIAGIASGMYYLHSGILAMAAPILYALQLLK